jgi:hypothetical protein
MTIRLVDTGWGRELRSALLLDSTALRIICPFIKSGALQRLLNGHRLGSVQVITRFNLADFAEQVSDIDALRALLNLGAQVRGVQNLHAKLYLFGSSCAVPTSANLTSAALDHNHELGFVSQDASIVERCHAYFDDLWARASGNLTIEQLEDWHVEVMGYRASGSPPFRPSGLGDYGASVGLPAIPSMPSSFGADARQAFVKFLGESDDRVPLSSETIAEVRLSGCHWALTYPVSKRPRSVGEGDAMFISRLTRGPNDIRVFGRALALRRHVPGRDDATPEDIARRFWNDRWPHYIRVYHAEFVAGSMENGVSLNELMATLGAASFASTRRNDARGRGNTDPRRAIRQQPAVALSPQGLSWLSTRLHLAFGLHGMVPADDLAKLDWPETT